MYVYHQRSGQLFHGEALVATGYSGFGEHKNKPESQDRVGLGPIPQGVYWIGKEREHDTGHGPVVLPLIPVTPGTETFGRSGFLIHGDSREAPGAASHGCIILAREVRENIADRHERLLVVLP